MAVSAADCAGLHPGRVPQSGGGAYQTLLPSETEGRQAAAGSGIEDAHGRTIRVRGAFSRRVGDRSVDVMAVEGHPPLDAAVSGATAHAGLPHDLAFFVGIKGVHNRRFLAGQNQLTPFGRLHQQWRRAEIKIRSLPGGIDIIGGGLRGSDDFSTRGIQRNQSIARGCRRFGKIVSRGDVD
jgi:hypothetical protein